MIADPGPLLFARYAYPPNALGYCGPQDHRALLEYAAAGVVDRGLRELAQGFDGAWPYLRLIAEAAGISVVIIVAVNSLGTKLTTTFESVTNNMK